MRNGIMGDALREILHAAGEARLSLPGHHLGYLMGCSACSSMEASNVAWDAARTMATYVCGNWLVDETGMTPDLPWKEARQQENQWQWERLRHYYREANKE